MHGQKVIPDLTKSHQSGKKVLPDVAKSRQRDSKGFQGVPRLRGSATPGDLRVGTLRVRGARSGFIMAYFFLTIIKYA